MKSEEIRQLLDEAPQGAFETRIVDGKVNIVSGAEGRPVAKDVKPYAANLFRASRYLATQVLTLRAEADAMRAALDGARAESETLRKRAEAAKTQTTADLTLTPAAAVRVLFGVRGALDVVCRVSGDPNVALSREGLTVFGGEHCSEATTMVVLRGAVQERREKLLAESESARTELTRIETRLAEIAAMEAGL